MIITKEEPAELAIRQQRWLALIRPDRPTWNHIPSLDESCQAYQYEYIIGREATEINQVYTYLEKNVWCRYPLTVDCEKDGEMYADYVASIGTANEPLLQMLRTHRPPVLVHGDATLENFIVDQNDKVAPIDPGLPRGFNCRENDVGKLLQSWLTHWATISRGLPPRESEDPRFPITTLSMVGLATHWYRILKNRDRHPIRVARYGEKMVGILCRAVDDHMRHDSYSMSEWGLGELTAIRNCAYALLDLV